MRRAEVGTRESIAVGPFTPNEFILVADRFSSKLLDLDPHHHRSRMSVMHVPYRSGNPFLPIADNQEQLECRDHWSSLCLGCTSSLLAYAPLTVS